MPQSTNLTQTYAAICRSLYEQTQALERLCQEYISSFPPSARQGLFSRLAHEGLTKKSVVAAHGDFLSALVVIGERSEALTVRLDALMQNADAESNTALILQADRCMTQYQDYQASVDATVKSCEKVLSADEDALSLAALFRQITELRVRTIRFCEFLQTETES